MAPGTCLATEMLTRFGVCLARTMTTTLHSAAQILMQKCSVRMSPNEYKIRTCRPLSYFIHISKLLSRSVVTQWQTCPTSVYNMCACRVVQICCNIFIFCFKTWWLVHIVNCLWLASLSGPRLSDKFCYFGDNKTHSSQDITDTPNTRRH